MKSTIIIKVGSSSIADIKSQIDIKSIRKIVQEIKTLKTSGHDVILVSSGAVTCGRSVSLSKHRLGVNNQVYAAIGQPKLFGIYQDEFQHAGLMAAQVLITREDLKSRHKYLNIRRAFEAMLEEGIVPIVNENDTVSVNELMFTDNDELATTIAVQLAAEWLIILTESGGVYTGNPNDEASSLITTIEDLESVKFLDDPKFKTTQGRGGIWSKINCGLKAASLGTECYITALNYPNILTNCLQHFAQGTHFPAQKKLKSKKAWLAQNLDEVRGSIILTEAALPYFQTKDLQARSLLPIGIKAIVGNFQAGDFVEIKDHTDQIVGKGITEYDAEQAKNWIGQKNKDPLIHYDNLFLHE